MSTEEKDIATQPKHENPFLLPYGTPHNTPPFGRFTLQDVEEAMLEGMRREDEEVEQMLADPAEPTFDNTLVRDHDDHPKDYYTSSGASVACSSTSSPPRATRRWRRWRRR